MFTTHVLLCKFVCMFVTKSTEYLQNKQTDTEQITNVESTFKMMNFISEVFNDRLPDIKQAIVSASNS